MKRTLLFAPLLGLLTASCGSSSDTTASGASYSGTYAMRALTLGHDGCQSNCPDLSDSAPTWLVTETNGNYSVTAENNNNVFPATAANNGVTFTMSSPFTGNGCTGTETVNVALAPQTATASATVDISLTAPNCSQLPSPCDCTYNTTGTRQ